jgi:hypothetical protein
LTELNEIKRDGATPQKNSGRGMYQKGDATLGPLLIDYKEYDESFGVSRKVWAKLQKDAFSAGQKVPVLRLVLGSKDDPNKLRLWVVSDLMFREMLDAWEQIYGDESR